VAVVLVSWKFSIFGGVLLSRTAVVTLACEGVLDIRTGPPDAAVLEYSSGATPVTPLPAGVIRRRTGVAAVLEPFKPTALPGGVPDSRTLDGDGVTPRRSGEAELAGVIPREIDVGGVP